MLELLTVMRIVKPLKNLIESFESLPGIGPKTAERLSYYLLHVPQSDLDQFASALTRLKKDTVLCSQCHSVSETDPCPVCADPERNRNQILVVEQPLDVVAFEKTGKYKGLYHVLHGAISPLDNIGPEEIYMNELFERANSNIEEIIVATNPTLEGEATAMFISKKIKSNGFAGSIKVSRLGVGLPNGAYLEFADEGTLIQAFEGRKDI